MITLDYLYRDINSFFGEKGVNEQEIFHLDTVKVINHLIPSLRIEYIQNGLGHEFVEPQTVTGFIKEPDFPFVYSADLPKPILRSLPVAMSVKQSMFPKTPNTLTSTFASWEKGDIVKKDSSAYVAVEHVPAINSLNLTFEDTHVRYWTQGATYFKDEIVYENDSFYRLDTPYVNEGVDIETAPVTKVYWRKIGGAYFKGTALPFNRLYESKLSTLALRDHYAFAIREEKVYTPVDTPYMVLYYIPEWEPVEDLSEELNIPDSMITPLKQQAISTLAQRLGIPLE